MKKIILIFCPIIVIINSIFFFVPPVQASRFGEGLANTAQKVGFASATLEQYAASIVQALLGLVGIIFVALLIYGGFLYMTSGGEKEKVKKGKTSITAAIIGLLIVISGYSITYFIASTLESPGDVTPAFNAEYENPGSQNYNSCEGCAYRYQKYGTVGCCEQTCPQYTGCPSK